MSTPNFKPTNGFPLIVTEPMYVKRCIECGMAHDVKANKCEECGGELGEEEYDWLGEEYTVHEMELCAERINACLLFHKVEVCSGYYCGVQFDVELLYGDIEMGDNEFARETFDMCRSGMIKKYRAEKNRVTKALRKCKEELGLIELEVAAIFSNGEAIYSKVG